MQPLKPIQIAAHLFCPTAPTCLRVTHRQKAHPPPDQWTEDYLSATFDNNKVLKIIFTTYQIKNNKLTMTDNLELEKTLWLAADKLRNNMDAAEYKHVVLGLIFLKYISDTFEELY